tara:strand:- start:122 stop:355 length:234 start_codon:yes stop_codon:yes gene_type:complete
MNNTDLQAALIEYANEDMGYAADGGSMVITDTKVGLITLNFANGLYQAFNRHAEKFTNELNRTQMEKWLVKQYVVEN